MMHEATQKNVSNCFYPFIHLIFLYFFGFFKPTTHDPRTLATPLPGISGVIGSMEQKKPTKQDTITWKTWLKVRMQLKLINNSSSLNKEYNKRDGGLETRS